MFKSCCFFLSLLWLICFPHIFLYASSEKAPLLVLPEDDTELFVERMASRHIIPDHHWNIMPWTRSMIARTIIDISKETDGKNKISATDRKYLEVLKRRFASEIQAISNTKPEANSSFYKWKDNTGSSVNINLFLFGSTRIDDSTSSTGYILSPGYGGRIYGRFRNNIGYYVQDKLAGGFSNQERFHYNFNPNNGEFIITPPETRYDSVRTKEQSYERYRGWISARINGVNILAGLDSPKWGTAGLGLSGDAPPFAQVRLWADMGIMRFTYFHGNIRSADDSSSFNNIINLRKYFVGQRIDLVLPFHLNAAYYSTLMYGNRGPDLLYLVPVTPLFFGEHFNGDRDNVAMGFDLSWNAIKKLNIYGELFLDDLLSPVGFLNDYWGNKWAFALGTSFYPSWYGKMWKIDARYTRIEPWVYTHIFGEITRYRHFGTCLGSPLGPDSDQWRIKANCRLNTNIEIFADASGTRHGDSPNGGSDITDKMPSAGDKKKFLGGQVETETGIAFGSSYRIHEALRTEFSYRYSLYDNWKNVSGSEHSENVFSLNLILDW